MIFDFQEWLYHTFSTHRDMLQVPHKYYTTCCRTRIVLRKVLAGLYQEIYVYKRCNTTVAYVSKKSYEGHKNMSAILLNDSKERVHND